MISLIEIPSGEWSKPDKKCSKCTAKFSEDCRIFKENGECITEKTEKVNEITDFLYIKEIKEDVEITFDSWGKYISITNVKDTKLFNNFVIALTELYETGEKEASGNDGVRYSFDGKVNESDFYNTIHVSLTVKTSVTGCKLIKETVVIPEKITPEHTEEKITVKCE